MTMSEKFSFKRELVKGSESFPFQMSRKISFPYLIMGHIQKIFFLHAQNYKFFDNNFFRARERKAKESENPKKRVL